MIGFALHRIAQAAPALIGVTLVAFVLLRVSGDMTYVLLPREATPDQRAEFRRLYGLDEPIPVQYLRYMARVAQGDFGRSFVHGRPAMAVVLDRLPATLQLTAVAMLIGVAVAIRAGVLSALRRNSIFDRCVMVLVLISQAMPTFWLGILLILAFAVHFQLFPVSGRGGPAHLILPALTLATWPLALTARLTRSSMLEALSQEYVLTARSKGLHERHVAWRHVLRNVLLPVVTVLGVSLGGMIGGMIGGAVLTETIFAWPGMGTLVTSAILTRDYPVVMASLIFVATVLVLVNMTVDILYGYLDPRITAGYER